MKVNDRIANLSSCDSSNFSISLEKRCIEYTIFNSLFGLFNQNSPPNII